MHRPTWSLLPLMLAIACQQPPDGPAVAFEVAEPHTDDDLVLELSAEPPEGIRYAIAWEVEGQPLGDLDDERRVPAHRTRKGQVWTARVTASDDGGEGKIAESSVVIHNTAPWVEVAVEPATPRDGDDLVASWEGGDLDDDELQIAWSWTADGKVTGITAPVVPADATTRGQLWQATAVVGDGEDQTEATTAAVSVDNLLPRVTSLALSPADPTTTSSLEAAAGVEDDDGDPTTLSYTWTVDGQVVHATSPVLSAEMFGRGDQVTVEVTPHDGFAAGEPASTSTTVVNTAPVLASAVLDPAQPIGGQFVVCSATGWEDPDGDPAAWRTEWSVNGTPATQQAKLSSSAFAKGDTVTCMVTPVDPVDEGQPVTASAVVANALPVVGSVEISPAAPQEGDTLSLTVSGVADGDGDPVELGYAWFVDGEQAATGTATLSSELFDRGDTVHAVVTPFDGEHQGAPVSSASVTPVNSAPVIASLDLSPHEVRTTDSLTASYIATDADGDTPAPTWTWYVNDTQVDLAQATLPGSAFARGDVVHAELAIDDGFGGTDTATTSQVTVLNTAPSVASSTIGPDPAYEGDTLSCAGSGWSDADDDAPDYRTTWSVDGAEVATTTTLGSEQFAKGDSVTCALTPDDGTDLGTAVGSDPVAILNTAPVLEYFVLSTTEPTESTVLTVALGTTTDADGDPVEFLYAWSVNDTVVSKHVSLDGTSFDRGDTVQVQVTPTDGFDDGEPLTSEVATVVNTAPAVTSLSTSPTTPTTDTTIGAEATAEDPDGDAVTLAWTWSVNGAAAGQTTATLDPSWFVKGDTVAVSVVPSDGFADGEADSTSVVIANSPPSAPAITITPAEPTEGDSLQCVIDTESVDPDGDAFSYDLAWEVDGLSWNGLAGTITLEGDTVPADTTLADEEWTCVARAHDGTDPGAPALANVIPTSGAIAITDTYTSGEYTFYLTEEVTFHVADARETYQAVCEGLDLQPVSCSAAERDISYDASAWNALEIPDAVVSCNLSDWLAHLANWPNMIGTFHRPEHDEPFGVLPLGSDCWDLDCPDEAIAPAVCGDVAL